MHSTNTNRIPAATYQHIDFNADDDVDRNHHTDSDAGSAYFHAHRFADTKTTCA